jgi:hypothetical protein
LLIGFRQRRVQPGAVLADLFPDQRARVVADKTID